MDRASGLKLLGIVAVCVFAVAFAARVLGPSDFYSVRDQARTASLTADMLSNGRWVLPQDCIGEPTFKPVLYNWVAAAFVAGLGAFETAYKMPSVLGAAGVTLLIALGSPRLIGVERRKALVAAIAWVAMPSTLKHMYFCRPDMLFGSLLAFGWMGATGLLLGRAGTWTALAVWGAFAGALLTKGPLAFVLPVYVVLGAKVLTGRWRTSLRTGVVWGLPLAIAVAAVWLVLAWRIDPEHVRGGLLGQEVGGRLTGGFGNVLRVWEVPGWMLERAFPWSLVAGLTVVALARGNSSGEAAPRHCRAALLWVGLFALTIALLPGRGGSYLLPCYAALALLAAEMAAKLGTGVFLGFAGAVLVSLLGFRITAGPGTENELSEESRRFVHEARAIVTSHRTLCIQTGLTTVPALLGTNPAGEPSEADWGTAEFVVAPAVAGDVVHGPERVFERVLVMGQQVDPEKRFGLYVQVEREAAPPSEVRAVRQDEFMGNDGRTWRVARNTKGGIDLYPTSEPEASVDVRAASDAPAGADRVTAFETTWNSKTIFCIAENGRVQSIWKDPAMANWRAGLLPAAKEGPLREDIIASLFVPTSGLMAVACVDAAGDVVVYDYRIGWRAWRMTRFDVPGIVRIDRADQTGYAAAGFVATDEEGHAYWIGVVDGWEDEWRIEVVGE